MFLQIVLVCVLIYLIYRLKPSRPHNFPPGPPNYPIVGGLLSLGKTEGEFSADKLTNLSKTYGPVTGLYLRSVRTIVLNGYEIIKEISSRDDCSFRPKQFIFTFHSNGRSLGVFNSNGHLWKEQRRFAMRNLRDFGFGKSSMEGLIHEEAEECLSSIKKALKESPNSVISMHDRFSLSAVNLLLAVVTGKRYAHSDETFQKILKMTELAFRSLDSSGTIVNDYPWLRFIPIVNSTFKNVSEGILAVKLLLKAAFDEHKTTRSPNFSRDFMDIYIKEMEEEERNGIKNSTFFEEQLLTVGIDLFTAGAESTSNTIAFALLYMILHPEVQEKVHTELNAVVGKDRLPSVADKPKLHYMEAVMTEIYRINPIAPISVPHSNDEDIKLMGYDIPKDTLMLPSIRSIHMDKSYWGDPQAFRPERFLNDAGQFVKPERVLPFGLGKRVCLGEPLARMSAFFIFAAVIQKFTLEIPAGTPRPTTVPKDGVTVAPQPFLAKLIPRN